MAYTQQGTKLVGTGYTFVNYNPAQGISVALSSGGDTLAVGGFGDNDTAGATWIFTRSGGAWTQQGSKLVGTGATGSISNQGFSVALSGDGNTLALGAPGDDTNIGATWIFTRSGGTWTQQGTKLVGTGYTNGPLNVFQGIGVALSNDGNTLAVGGYQDNSGIGATWIFTRSGGAWTQQGSKLVGTGYATPGSAFQGVSVALSSDGDTLAVGGPLTNTSIGATWIFTRSGGAWTQQGTKLVGTGYTPSSYGPGTPNQGAGVSLSGDGNTLAVGGPQDDTYIGATWIFTRSSGTWTQQGIKLIGTGYVGNPNQGAGVSLSGDGNTLAIGGNWDDNTPDAGATWIFTRSGGAWTQQGTKLVGTGGSASNQGRRIALSSDSFTLAIGGANDDSGIGAAWIFSLPAPAVTTTTTPAPAVTTTTTPAPITTTTTAAPITTTTTAAPITTTTTLPPAKLFTLTNTGKIPLEIQSMTFTDPVGITHTANLSNLGGGSAVATNQTALTYNLQVGTPATFTVDYRNVSAPIGTYSGRIVINGQYNTTQTIVSNIVVNAKAVVITTTTTAAPAVPIITTTTTAAPSAFGWVPLGEFFIQGGGATGLAAVGTIRFETDGTITKTLTGNQVVFSGPTQYAANSGSNYSIRAKVTGDVSDGGTWSIFGNQRGILPVGIWTTWYPLSSYRVISGSIPSHSGGTPPTSEFNVDIEIKRDIDSVTITNTAYFEIYEAGPSAPVTTTTTAAPAVTTTTPPPGPNLGNISFSHQSFVGDSVSTVDVSTDLNFDSDGLISTTAGAGSGGSDQVGKGGTMFYASPRSTGLGSNYEIKAEVTSYEGLGGSFTGPLAYTSLSAGVIMNFTTSSMAGGSTGGVKGNIYIRNISTGSVTTATFAVNNGVNQTGGGIPGGGA